MKGIIIGAAALGAVVWGGYMYVAAQARPNSDEISVSVKRNSDDRESNSSKNSDVRKMSNFKGIDVSSAFEVVYKAGDSFTLEVEGPSDIISKVRSEVKNGILKVDFSESVEMNDKVTLRITAPKLASIKGSGACEFSIADTGDLPLAINLSGASKMTLESGTHPSLNVICSGSSEMTIEDQNLEKLEMNLEGSSIIQINGVTKTAKFNTSGSCELSGDMYGESAEATTSGASSIELGKFNSTKNASSGSSEIKFGSV
jgi:hypothetical protein